MSHATTTAAAALALCALWAGPATAAPLGAAWVGGAGQAGSGYGASVASAGDVNGDGFDDVLVGAPHFDGGQLDEGGACLYLGSAAGLPAAPAWTVEGEQVAGALGTSVASAGDVDGDGFDDVLVGMPRFDAGIVGAGAALLYTGSAAGPGAVAAWSAEGAQPWAELGTSVAGAGDVDGDGFDDVIVGMPGYDNGEIDEGAALLYLGSAAGLAPVPAWTAELDVPGAQLGSAVAAAGDVNGDGFDDVIVGARYYSNGQTREGAAFVFLGSAAGLAAAPAWSAESDQAHARFGASVASAGDVNGDGFDDVVIGAYDYDHGANNEGVAAVFHGSAGGLGASPAWTAEANQAEARFGWAVASAGDVNGDGFDDVIVGADGYDAGETDEGAVGLFLGSPSGLGPPGVTKGANQTYASFGSSVAAAGDVDGDGLSDVLVGAVDYTADDQGAAFLFLGR